MTVTDLQDEKGRDLAESLGPSSQYERLDVREACDWERAIELVLERFGHLDIVVNNAGLLGSRQGRSHTIRNTLLGSLAGGVSDKPRRCLPRLSVCNSRDAP